MAKAGVSQLTYADLQALPDDHNRYELIDGELLVSPAPDTAHQRAVVSLILLLAAACPAGHEVLTAPFDWLVDDLNVFEPDVLVVRVDDLTERNLPVPPVLAVEVLSPFEPGPRPVRKRAAYERAGLDHYWLVDPASPSVTMLERVAGRYREVAHGRGDTPVAVARPFPVTLVPSDLLR